MIINSGRKSLKKKKEKMRVHTQHVRIPRPDLTIHKRDTAFVYTFFTRKIFYKNSSKYVYHIQISFSKNRIKKKKFKFPNFLRNLKKSYSYFYFLYFFQKKIIQRHPYSYLMLPQCQNSPSQDFVAPPVHLDKQKLATAKTEARPLEQDHSNFTVLAG